MPRGASPEREDEYKELVGEFKHDHRYPGREEEVAARIVNKQRAEHGETQAAEEQDRQGTSEDKGLPVPDYDRLTVEEVEAKLDGLDMSALKAVHNYEQQHNNRRTLQEALDHRLSHG